MVIGTNVFRPNTKLEHTGAIETQINLDHDFIEKKYEFGLN